MGRITLVLTIRDQKISLDLRRDIKVIDSADLTLGRDFDILLIRTLDKILRKNKIDGLSLKSVKIAGKLRPGVVSGMIIKILARAIAV